MKIKQILTAVALTLCILSAAVVFTLNFRPLYYMDIHHFQLPENTGYSCSRYSIEFYTPHRIQFSVKNRAGILFASVLFSHLQHFTLSFDMLFPAISRTDKVSHLLLYIYDKLLLFFHSDLEHKLYQF